MFQREFADEHFVDGQHVDCCPLGTHPFMEEKPRLKLFICSLQRRREKEEVLGYMSLAISSN